MSNRIEEIFNTNSKCEVIRRFLVMSEQELYKDRNHESPRYIDAICALRRSIESEPFVTINDLQEACQYFAIAENSNLKMDCIYAKIGQVVCHYVLGNILSVESIVKSIVTTNIPKNLNPKGILQNAGKGVLIATSVAISFVPQLKNAAIVLNQHASRFKTEDPTIPDPNVSKLISDVKAVKFNELYEKLNK